VPKYEMRYATFGALKYQDWEKCYSDYYDGALQEAYECAVENYRGYGGRHGLFSYEEALKQYPDLTEEELEEMEQEDIDSTIAYEVREVSD